MDQVQVAIATGLCHTRFKYDSTNLCWSLIEFRTEFKGNVVMSQSVDDVICTRA